MNLNVDMQDGQLVVTLQEARLDAFVATGFKDRMREIIHRPQDGPLRPVILDMNGVDFMDSSGLGALIAVHKAMPPGRTLEIAGLTPNVERVFRLTRMDSVFAIHGFAPRPPQAPA